MADTKNATLVQKIYNRTCDILDRTIEIGASLKIGQNILKQVDNVLWILEKSAEWSIPVPTVGGKQAESNGTFGKPGPLIRPLPWILFLPLLMILRLIRLVLNVGAIFIGMDSVKPTTVVKFIQIRRRRVRAMKFRGHRLIVRRSCRLLSEKEEAPTWKQRIYNMLRGAVCLNYKHTETIEKLVLTENINEKEVTAPAEQKRKHKDVDSEEELEDPAYILSDSLSEDESVSDEEDESILVKELIKRPSSNSLTNETIEEENELSDSSTASAESKDSQKHKEFISSPVSATEKLDENQKSNEKHNKLQVYQNDGITSDEFFSPEDSECASPEPKILLECNNTKDDLSESQNDVKTASNLLIAAEQVQKNVNGSNLSTNKMKTDGNNVTYNNYRSHGKRKNKKKFSNPFNRKRK